MEQLLDFSKDVDTDLLDRIVTVFFSGQGSAAEVCLISIFDKNFKHCHWYIFLSIDYNTNILNSSFFSY